MNKVDQAIKKAAKNRIAVCSRFGSVEEEAMLRSLATYMEKEYPNLSVKELFWDKWGSVWPTMNEGREASREEEGKIFRCFTAWANDYGINLYSQLKVRPGAEFLGSMHYSGCVTYPFSNNMDDDA